MKNWEMKLLVWKMMCGSWYLDKKQKGLRRKYCRKGYHKLRSGSRTIIRGNKEKIIRYLICSHCNYLFFAYTKDKKSFEKMEVAKEDFSALHDFLSYGKLEHTKPTVGSLAKKLQPDLKNA